VDAPELGLDSGASIAIGLAGVPFSDVLTHPIPAPIPIVSTRPKAEPPAQLLVGGNVQEAKLIYRVQPLYPALARQVRVQGVVVLEAIIAANGSIQQLHVLSGHPMLIPSAVEAVRQWIYSPTILNGKAVEVKTTIEVRFTLSEK
jgi:protein TonB